MAVLSVADDDEIMVISEQGMIMRISVSDIRIIGRATQGVRIMDLDEGDRIVAVAKVVETEEDGSDDSGENAAADSGEGGDE